MYLKELTAAGFKSFASTTRFRFEPGITAIVGPNGSGKSNVVDALAWVMGEQGAKSLRGANMADVIFAGGTTRGALGRAHVELTIDNSDGRLPIAYSEVTISRTMFRSGGSEYAINRQPVRLLDVQELLSDSGLGRQMHVIVGQGQLDAVLSASPTDRRAFIDEAAGVAKHRRRKERALRKLDSMDANLVRVLDLTEEMKSRLRPLARQAKAAREAAGVRYALGYATARLLADDLVTARVRRDREFRGLEELRASSKRDEAELDALKVERDRLGSAQTKARERADLVGERYRDFTEQRERLASLAEIARERADSAARVPTSVSLGAVELADDRAKESRLEADRSAQAVVAAEADYQAARQQRADAEASRREAEASLARCEAVARQRQDERVRLQRAQESAKAGLVAATGQVKVAGERLTAAEQRLADAAAEVQRFSTSLGGAEGAASAVGAPSTSENGADQSSDEIPVAQNLEAAEYDLAAEREREARDAFAEAERKERSAAEELSRLRSRRETLAASLSGASSGAARAGKRDSEVARELRERLPKGDSVEDVLLVERGWEEAVAALLGVMLDAQVLSKEQLDDVVRVLPNWVSTPELGRSGFVEPVSGEADGCPDELLLSVAAEHNVISAASVVSEREGDGAVASLVAHAWVCEGVEEARSFLRALARRPEHRNSRQVRVATRSGMVVGDGYVRLRGRQETSNLSLKADLAEAQDLEARAHEVAQDAKAQSRLAGDALAKAIKAKDAALSRLRAADAQRARNAQELTRLRALEHAARVEVDRVVQQVRQAEEREESAQKAWEKSCAQTPDNGPQDDVERLEAARNLVTQTREKVDAAREVENDGRLALHVAQERANASHRQAQGFATQAQSLREDRERQLAREEASSRAVAGFQQVMAQARDGAQRAQRSGARALELRTQAREEHDRLARELAQTSASLSALESRQKEASERLLQGEVAYASHQAEVERLEERARELIDEYGRLLNLRAPSLMRKYGESEPSSARWAASEPGPPHDDESAGPLEMSAEDGDERSADTMAADAVIRAYGPHLPWAPHPPGAPENADRQEESPSDGIPDRESYSRGRAEAEQQQAQRSLNRLGVVNPLAIEEYEAASARFTFLEGQVEDLHRSKADLLALIREVDEQVRQAFMSAFADTAEKFEHTFAALFPGGTGRLEQTDPDDPLGTGIEIYARPSGKRVTRLSLLSGGERSLAALAYLIAIFQARPSPFYVLDEIEAALDDLNLSRVLGLLEELRKESQLLIITHQKRTMEFADALYGVTMKDGVTAVMSHKMSDG